MKILQINASYKPAYVYGGPTMSVSKLSEQLINAGCSVQVFTTTANGPAELPLHEHTPVITDGVPVYYFKRLTKDHSHFSPGLLLAVWRRAKQFDVVHIHAWWNTVSVLSCLAAIMRRVPVVVSPRGTLSAYSFGNKNAFFKKCIHLLLTKPLLKRSNIHATSVYEQGSLSDIITAKRFFNIPNFIELPDHVNKQSHEYVPLKLIFFSRIEEKKGLDILLRALPCVNIPYQLTIAGEGEERYVKSLKQLADELDIAHRVNWFGFISNDKFRILADHDLMVLPSYDENFGNVVIESLSAGTAVLVSEQVGLSAYVRENDLGWICRTDPLSVTNTINNIDHHKLTAIAGRAPAQVRRDHSEQHLVEKYKDMYQQIIKNG